MQSPHPAGWFVAAMDEWRQELGLNHQEFAAYLERSEGWWSLVRNGRRSLPLGIVRRVLRAKPGYLGFFVLDLVTDGPVPPDGRE